MPHSARPLIVLFRHDLRLRDNATLTAAIESSHPIIPCYIFDENEPWAMGGASKWWLHHSLTSLQQDLRQLGGDILLRRGALLPCLMELVNQLDAVGVYWTQPHEPHLKPIEQQLYNALTAENRIAKRFSHTLFNHQTIKTGGGTPFKIFTPFWRHCLQLTTPSPPLHIPQKALFGTMEEDFLNHLVDLNLCPTKPDWSAGLQHTWQAGETSALQRLEDFITVGLKGYSEGRNYPAMPHTSRLSPHLHFGEISPRIIWHRIHLAMTIDPTLEKDGLAFLREVGWREFAYYLLQHFPYIPEKPFKEQFSRFPWQENKAHLTAWQQGKTGYPLIDAGMRELWHTGYMHNRVRMIVASFLIKNLMIDWREGEAWFWDTLVDADLPNNAASWQWVAGSGTDASPFFRIFNPVTQSEKFDAEGEYIRQWIPELRDLPSRYIHAPWLAPSPVLNATNIQLGHNYPMPIVDLKLTRERALEGYKTIK